MKRLMAVVAAFAMTRIASADPTASAPEIVSKMLDSDPWGLSGASLTAHVRLTDKRGANSDMAFSAKSRTYDPPLAKSIVRFSAPPDLAGAGFLQVQRRDRDDDRYLYLPELKRSRRISGNLRANSFMGTDFSFADLDRRELRESTARLGEDESVGKWPCYVLAVDPKSEDAQYSRLMLWVRKDNYLPLRMKMYDRSGVLTKTFEALEVRRVSGHWFVSRSRMHDEQHEHTTELVLDDIEVKSDIDDDQFTVRALEKPQGP